MSRKSRDFLNPPPPPPLSHVSHRHEITISLDPLPPYRVTRLMDRPLSTQVDITMT